MSKETFGCFTDAIDFYTVDSDVRYPVVVEMKQDAREATLRTGTTDDPMRDAYVVIWPRKDSRGDVEPERVWAEEY